MIENRLRILLAERHIPASKLAEDTGITNATLSKIVNNQSRGINFKTLDTICRYLKITPNEFFEMKENED